MRVVKWAFASQTFIALLPAQDQDAYARVLYFANKPGADPMGRDAFLDKVDQGRAAAVAAGESGGYPRLTLVHPSAAETGHVRLAFVKFKPVVGGDFQKAIPQSRAVMEQVLKSGGPTKAYWLITTMLSGERALYNAIEVYAYATEADMFKEAHDDDKRPNSEVRSQEVFRVSSAY